MKYLSRLSQCLISMLIMAPIVFPIEYVSAQTYILQENPEQTTQEPQQENQEKTIVAKINSDQSFSFSLSPLFLDYGPLSPTNPTSRDIKMSINAQGTRVTVLAYQDSPLHKGTDAIPSTSCDNGACKLHQAALWANTLTYGFGFRCENKNVCSSDFKETSFFRPYASASLSQMPISVLISAGNSKLNHISITNKINIAGTQSKSSYEHILYFIAIPNL